MMMQVDEPIIKVSNLKKYFPVSNKIFDPAQERKADVGGLGEPGAAPGAA
jgi:hypothetical protein